MTDLHLLITPQALVQAASPDGDGRFALSDSDLVDELRAAIAHAQEAVAGELGYHPLVHAVQQPSRPFLSATPTGPFLASGMRPTGYVYATDRPVVEVFTAGVEHLDRTLAYTGAYPLAGLAYAAGWRGAHHVLAAEHASLDLKQLPGLSNLSVLPALLPGDVRSVLVEVALIEIDRRRLNLLGGRRNTVQIGEGQYRSEGYRPTAEAEALARIAHHHRIPRL